MPCPSVSPKLFWTHPEFFRLDQKQLFTAEFHIVNSVQKVCSFSKTIWTVPKLIWTCIEGQGISAKDNWEIYFKMFLLSWEIQTLSAQSSKQGFFLDIARATSEILWLHCVPGRSPSE